MQRDDFEVKLYPGIDAVGVSDEPGRLRLVIVTEEILGPVRNGGIASTYYHLAKGLAAQGHEVHVLFLKGPVVQDETPEHWVEHYAEFGVALHYLDTQSGAVWGVASHWQRRYAGAYAWLRDQEPFDVVHTSEWRGGLVYALMAKRLGLAFQDTLFLVKTSSPYIWNRHYQMQPITQPDLLAASYAEQKCVELADMVIGGSAHLISFMDRIGYRLPEANVHVQPNIMDFSNVHVVDNRPGPPRQPGDIVRTRDFVFFGRLEARKGIEVFCGAVDLLHERGEIPDSVTFLGKWGGALPAQGGQSPEDFVAEKAATWECPVSIVTDRHQADALSLMSERDVIAVMPSLIENSSMAVYEVLEHRIPFIASDVGGSPELIAEGDQSTCLVDPTAEALADRMEKALVEGHVIARPQFSNEQNLKTWYGFHAHLGAQIELHGREQAVKRLTSAIDRAGDAVATLGYVALVRRGESLDDLVKALHADAPDHLVLGYRDASTLGELERVRDLLAELDCEVTVVNCLGNTSGGSLNTLLAAQQCDALVVSDGVGVVPQLGFFDTARRALTARPDCLFTTFFNTGDLAEGMPLGGDVASQFMTSRAYGPELVALRSEIVTSLGGFEEYDAVSGIVHEFVTRACRSDHDLLVYPEPLLTWRSAIEDSEKLQTDPLYAYLKAKALIDDSGLNERKLFLAALSTSGGATGVNERLLRPPGDESGQTHWLMPATSRVDAVSGAETRRLLVGLDAEHDELWLYARGPGERRLVMRGEDLPIDLLAHQGEADSEECLTIHTFAVPRTWEKGASYPLTWGTYDGPEKLRNLFLRVNKIGAATLALSSRQPVLSPTRLTEIFEGCTMKWQPPPDHHREEPSPSTDAEGGATEPSVGTDTRRVESDPTEEYVSQALTAARGIVQRHGRADPVKAMMVSRQLIDASPPTTPLLITPRSGLKSPDLRDGWVAGDWLEGWAWDREERSRELHVALMRGRELLAMALANEEDPSLDEVPGRDRHGFRIPVMPEFLDGEEQMRLMIWEGQSAVFRAGLYVDRSATPMLRRCRPTAPDDAEPSQRQRRKRNWWNRR